MALTVRSGEDEGRTRAGGTGDSAVDALAGERDAVVSAGATAGAGALERERDGDGTS
jgi:hypothetical protein